EAFKGTKGIFFPKYDNADEIYTYVLDELAELAAKMPQAYAKMSEAAKASFALQDIAFLGDVSKWVQYIHSVRLRHAVRMSGVNPDFAKTHIQAVLNTLPNEDMIFENIRENENSVGTSAGGIYARAIYEHIYSTLIPNVIMQRMNYGGLEYVEGEDDPRLPVIANPIRYSNDGTLQFNGCSMDWDSMYPYWPTITNPDGSTFDAGPGLTFRTYLNYPTNIETWLQGSYSQYNLATFAFGEIPAYMNSRAENDLFLAEVELKNLANTGKTAGEHIKNSVIHSTDFWYRVNRLSKFIDKRLGGNEFYTDAFRYAKPSDAIINQFAEKIKQEFEDANSQEDKMEIIMQQKYIHHNILNVYELWAELRRTRHPKLEKLKVKGDIFDPVPERLRYPTSELQTNTENFYEVIDENDFTTPIFWVPANKRNEKHYRDGYLPLTGYLPLPNPNPNRP
ncbi:MAG: SusD/RagB family nutrient-binding outer membrane lipoprotein, partial [Prolixibacteraceae bacterium]|nr:SusD/RagB family nutrient-binding outer membrane lipoprotein [Prolixibacteraceae bacterium]